jgi:hypothetical protein
LKYVFIIVLLATLGGLVYWRLRPYIRMARRFLGVLRDVRRVGESGPTAGVPQRRRERASSELLVRCAACGTWLPASRAVRLRASQSPYCSHACLERAADAPRSSRKTAS